MFRERNSALLLVASSSGGVTSSNVSSEAILVGDAGRLQPHLSRAGFCLEEPTNSRCWNRRSSILSIFNFQGDVAGRCSADKGGRSTSCSPGSRHPREPGMAELPAVEISEDKQ